MKLYICGNGFDLHHGYKTGYRDYREFLLKNHSHAFSAFEEFRYLNLSMSDKWSDLEQSLTIDYEKIISVITDYYPDINNSCDLRWYELDIDLEEQTKFIYDFTGRYFLEWLTLINFSDPKDAILLNKNDLFITFNYTSTLEEVYKIAADSIFHIHGRIDLVEGRNIFNQVIPSFTTIEEAENAKQVRVDIINSYTVRQQIQFGSVGNNTDTIKMKMKKKYGHEDYYSVSIEPGIEHIVRFCNAASKTLGKNYDLLKSFISKKGIDEVIVMGHSITGVDFAYYADVIIPVLKDCRWVFYWHSTDDRDKIIQFIKDFSLKDFALVEW